MLGTCVVAVASACAGDVGLLGDDQLMQHRALSCPAGLSDATVAIGVPVHNEAAALPRLLDALARQERAGLFTLCLFFDGCTDASEAVVAGAGALPFSIVTRSGPLRAHANAGRARRAAMALAIDVVADAPRPLVLATDADSVPADDWIATAAASLRTCDVVAGRVVRDGSEADPVLGRLEAYYDRLYAFRRALDPIAWEDGSGHHYTAGANLGFRLEVYRALGGFPELASGEDARLIDDAARAGLRVRRDPDLVVRTSARRDGRAEGGLATILRRLDQEGEAALTVGDPAAAAWQYRRQAAARAAFEHLPSPMVAATLGRQLGLSGDHVVGVGRDCPNSEAFAMRIVPAAPGAAVQLPLAEAERALALLERATLDQAA